MKLISLAFASMLALLIPATVQASDPAQNTTDRPFSQVPGIYRVMIGSFKVTVLTDGTTPVPFDRLMHGIDKNALAAQFHNAGEPVNRETSINAFLIDTGERRILIDTGAGKVFGACCGHLAETLQVAGYAADTIDDVLLTHVHGDHSAGLTINGQRSFPNADVFLAKRELDYWMSDSAKAHAKASHQEMFVQGRAALAPYQAAGRIKTFSGRTLLFPGIQALPAAGHTPGHTFYEIESKGHHLRIVGDIIHAAEIQLPHPEITVDFDADEAQAASTRIAALQELSRTHELVAGPHISFPGLGHIIRSGEGFGWVPIPYSTAVREVGN
jgi:glyoxylase-like metal-dependent hydrolase (beta-lactamase superfamily II)